MLIKYCGKKDHETAFEAESGVTWGPGVTHEIKNPDLAKRMLRHPDVFAIADEDDERKPTVLVSSLGLGTQPQSSAALTEQQVHTLSFPALTGVLLGSDTLPAVIEIGEKSFQLGEIVAKAHEVSELSEAEWNSMSAEQRDHLLNQFIAFLRDEAQKHAQEAEQAAAKAAEKEAAEKEAAQKAALEAEQAAAAKAAADAKAAEEARQQATTKKAAKAAAAKAAGEVN